MNQRQPQLDEYHPLEIASHMYLWCARCGLDMVGAF